ncbi:hypothetical protein JRI60_12790 [Archangium violaceum]|uniref:hypothetical protein n=1 Tax=Archangium violaceum TaxID=83451 RepID=UPI00194EB8B1|nr:hypothetical protein [Archangium violaceum]QRN99833.1 hypothetical protein JRI60_12790 [Archangium violaceum]
MRGSPLKAISILAFAAVATGVVAHAAAPAPGQNLPPLPRPPVDPAYCYNVDVTNATRTAANDLHFTLSGPTKVYNFYTGGHFGLPTSYQQNANGTWSVDYSASGIYVNPGEFTHVGWCGDKPIAGMTVGSKTDLPPFYWTRDGRVIGRITPVGHDWGSVILNDQRFVEVRLTNTLPTPIRIGRLDWAVLDQPIALDDLMWDPLDKAIAWKPLQAESILPGGSADAPGTLRAIIPLPVESTETRHVVFRVLASDAEQPENLIRGIGQANIAAAVQPRE